MKVASGVTLSTGTGVSVGTGTGVSGAAGTSVFCEGRSRVFVGAGIGVSVAAGSGVFDAVGSGVFTTAQDGPVKVLVSNVTAPVCAKARPFNLAPVCRLIDVDARIVPINDVFVPSVAELTARHHTLQGLPPTILALPDVIRSAADLKIQTPVPVKVSVPDNRKAPAQ